MQQQDLMKAFIQAASNAWENSPMGIGQKVASNPQQFVQNAAAGAGNLVKSTVAIPGNVYNSVKKGTEAEDLQNLAKGAVKQYSDIAQHPTQSFYNDPVGTVAAIAPAVSGLGKIGELGKAAGAADEIPGGVAKDIPENAAQTFNSRYNIPTKRAGTNDLNTIGTSKEILAHVKGGMDVNSVDSVPEQVTGDQGLVTKMTRNAVANIPHEIDFGMPNKSAANILDTNKVWVTPSMRDNVLEDINRGQPLGQGVSTANPQDAFDYARQLEAKAAQAKRSSTYLTPRPDMEIVAKAYNAAADEIMNQIDKAGKGVAIDTVKTPENIQALHDISPRLAAQVAAANDVSSLRSTAAPFVRLSKMQELDQAAKNSTFSQVAQGMKKPPIQPASAAGAAIGGAIGGLPGAGVGYGVGNIVDRVMTPEYTQGMNKIEQPLQDMMLNRRLNGQGVPTPPVGKGLPAIGALSAVGEQAIQNNPQQQQNPAIVPNQSNHGASVATPAPVVNSNSYSSIKPDTATGKFELPQSPPDGQNGRHYMNEGDYQNQLAVLGQHYTYGTPQYNQQAALLQSQYSGDQKQADEVFKGNNVKNFMDNAVQYNNDGKDLADTLHALPPGFWNGVSKAGSVRAYTDPAYAQQLQQIDAFNTEFTSAYKSVTGEDPKENQLLSSANSGGQAAKKYVAMMQFISGTYGKYLDPYLALTSATGRQTKQATPQGLPVAQVAQPQQNDFSNITGGSLPSLNGLPPISSIPAQ